ncbi:MAG TPA: 50S ribosomal protein L24 [Candidatus Deferrimicrobium sp.]|nr:50S ribosomal protein L24 [Candidatus Deferrimicrobium sp.]
MHIRKGDTVYIRSGSSRGKTGRVLFVNVSKQTVVVEGVNMKKRHRRPTQKNPKGGILSIEAPVHVSNVALYSAAAGGPTRVSTRLIEEGGRMRRVRVSRKTGEQL